MTQPILELLDIHKGFPGILALSGVTFEMYPGEVHALLGENGAGKSTLIKIMSGVYRPDQGTMRLDGQVVQFANPREAQQHGIAVIYQEPMVFPDLDVAENIFISHQARGAVVNWRRMYRDAEEILTRLDVSLDPRSRARGLTPAEQQTLEIAKALSLKARVLIMDEPTASLSAHEVEQLFKLVRILRDQGVAILFISHRMEEVFEIADRVTVFRDGQLISSKPIAEVTRDGAIQDMVGRKLEAFFVRDPHPRGELLMSVRGLTKEGLFSDISFDLYRGEELGFAGLVGARHTNVGLALFGIEPSDSGEIILRGKAQRIHTPEQALTLGIAYVIMAPTTVGILAAAQAVRAEGVCGDVLVSGFGVSVEMQDFALWSFEDLGYLTYYTAYLLATGALKGEVGETFVAGRMGEFTIEETADGGKQVLMGPFTVFSPETIDDWYFDTTASS